MSRIISRGIPYLAPALVLGSAANAQQSTVIQRAPVPQQVLAARTVLIGNGGSESYGADRYFRLTKYDGGPDRPYTAFYNAMRSWGHYELVGATRDADLLLVIRFTNPIVDRQYPAVDRQEPNAWLYDPQLNLTINDPRTGLPLWTITEHIEPGRDRAADNRHFDDAVTRLLDDLKRLTLTPSSGEVSPAAENLALPPGAIAAAQRQQRWQHIGTGVTLGGLAGALIGFTAKTGPCDEVSACATQGQAQLRKAEWGTLGGAIAGAIVGLLWPVHF